MRSNLVIIRGKLRLPITPSTIRMPLQYVNVTVTVPYGAEVCLVLDARRREMSGCCMSCE